MATEEEFVQTIKAFSGIAGRRVDFVMRKIGFDALSSVLRRSPVDSGRFRGSWRYSVNTKDESVESVPEKGTKGSRSKGSAATGQELQEALTKNRTVTSKSVIHITNSLPYSVRLENGYSPQAPNGIVKPTIIEIRLGILKAIREAKKAVPDA